MASAPITAQPDSSQTQEHLQDAKESFRDAGSHLQQAASSAARGMGQQAQNAAANLTQKAKEVTSTAAAKAEDVAHKAEHQTDSALSAVGEKMSSLASSIRSNAPQEGMVGSAASTVADKLDTSGRYLRASGVRRITDDLAEVVRRHPIPAVITVFSVGLVIGMAARR